MPFEEIHLLKKEIERILNDNKAAKIETISLKGKTSIADFMIIASGNSSRHIQALSEILLDELKNRHKPIAVISNKPHEFAVECVKEFLSEHIDITIGSGDKYALKPDPESANHVLEIFNVDPKQCFFVGDSGFDIITARNTGMKSIGVLWGLSNEERLLKFDPDYLFNEPTDLLKFVKNFAL